MVDIWWTLPLRLPFWPGNIFSCRTSECAEVGSGLVRRPFSATSSPSCSTFRRRASAGGNNIPSFCKIAWLILALHPLFLLTYNLYCPIIMHYNPIQKKSNYAFDLKFVISNLCKNDITWWCRIWFMFNIKIIFCWRDHSTIYFSDN